MPGKGFNLNPFEASTLQALIGALSHPGTADIAGQLGMSTIGGAQERRATNVATREQGMQALQQQAMQLAAQGASRQAVQQAITGQANDLPLTQGPQGQQMVGDLHQYVKGLDWEPGQYGPISGLAPLDMRAQFQSNMGLAPEDRSAVSTLVVQGLQSGKPLFNIREDVRQAVLATGAGEADVQEAVQLAEQTYGQATGMAPSDMRSMADTLRGMQSSDEGAFGNIFEDQNISGVNADTDIRGLLGQLASQPGVLQGLQTATQGYDPPVSQPGESGLGGLWNKLWYAVSPTAR